MSKLTPFPINVPGGIVKTESGRVSEGRWVDCDKVRFVRGLPQKLGGWTVQTSEAMPDLPRTIHCWRDLSAQNFIAAGTPRKLYVFDTDLDLNDITPFRSSGTLGADPFATVLGSSTVTVTDAGHGVLVGDTVIFDGATSFNGVTVDGSYLVTTIVSSSEYTIDVGTVASGTGTGGGAAVTFEYEISVGVNIEAAGLGWGVGGWGLSTWGTARSGSGVVTNVFEPRVWSFDHFGKILLSTYNVGSIFSFDPSVAQPWPRAQLITDAPTDVRALLVTPERFVFALREAMVLSSSTQNDYTTWTPASDNTAFSRTLTEGTRLVAARVLAPFVSLVWSDAAVYLFQYTGSQFVYNSSLIAKNCGLIGPNAAVSANGVAYWMGPDSFWMYSGSVQRMPNGEDIRHYVFSNIDTTTSFQCFAVYNPIYNEIYFGYTDGTQQYPTRYLLFSIDDQTWSIGTLTRVSGHNFTQFDTRPYFADADGYIYLHEDGNNANLSSLAWTLTMGPVTLQEGMVQMDVEAINYDFFEQAGDIEATINTYDRLTDAVVMDTETETVEEGENTYVEYRVNGRFIGLVLSQDGMNTYFRMGRPAAFVRPTGRRS